MLQGDAVGPVVDCYLAQLMLSLSSWLSTV